MAQVTHFMYGTSSTYRADAFTSASATNVKEGQITAAIAAAVADGVQAVFVPQSMLPYNASLVTFNSAVRMLREGGPIELWDLKAYGGDPVNADNAAAIAAVLANAPSGASVYAPTGNYNHTAITWNKRVNLVGDSSQGTTFTYTPTTGTAWTINATNNINQPDTFRFFGVGFNGPGSGTATTLWNISCDYFDVSYCSAQNFGLGLTFGNNAFFLNFFETNWQFCNQCLIWPNALTGAGENIRFNGCTFVNSTTFANGVQIDGNADVFFYLCSFDNCQLSVTRAGAAAYVHGGHFELVALNPALPMISQTAGVLYLAGQRLLIPVGSVAVPQAITANDTNDAGNTALYISAFHAFTSAGTASFLGISGGIHVNADYDIQGNWSNDLTGTTTGLMVLNASNNRVLKTNGGFAGQWSNQADTTLVSGISAALAGMGCSVTLTANRVAGALTSPTKGQRFTFTIIQDGTGGRTLTWNAVYKLTWSDVGNTLGKRSSISVIYDGTNWNQDGAQTPYV